MKRLDDKEELSNEENLIPHPINEPVIGVIDTHFNEKSNIFMSG